MTQPVTYVELNSPDQPATVAFFSVVFGWDAQPFADPDYLVAPSGEQGVDTGILSSRDGVPRTVPVISVPSIAETRRSIEQNGGTIVVEPFTIPGVGHGCYFTDPAGLIAGLHQYDPDA